MKIAFVVGSLSGGGAERIVAAISSEMAEIGHEVSVILIASTECNYDISNKVKIIDCSKKYKKLGFIKRVAEIRRVISQHNFDVCVSFTVAVNLYSVLSCLGENIKLILAERNDPRFDPTNRIFRIMRSILYPLADSYVFQTNNEKAYFSKSIQRRSIVIPNPVNPAIPNAFAGKRKSRIVTAARLVPQKNIKMAIDAFSIVHQKYPEYSFDIYGQGPLLDELKEYSSLKGTSKAICFKGNSTNLYEEILDAQIFVLSSDYEGMSNSMIEAMALGIPTISTDYPSGGASDLIDNYVNGILVPVGNVEALSCAMVKLIENAALVEQISQNGMKIRETLDIALITNKWIEFIEDNV